MTAGRVPFSVVLPAMPWSRHTAYKYHREGRAPWLQRGTTSDGTLRLVVDWPAAVHFFAGRGVDLDALAVQHLPAPAVALLRAIPQK
jgi:hypothetical protein